LARVLIPLPDRDFDPTEAAVPWKVLREGGHEIVFATERAATPACDPRLIDGVLFGELGATAAPKACYAEMVASKELKAPIPWESIEPAAYDALVLPGGHAPGMKQLLGSGVLQAKVGAFSDTGKPMAAICHGVLVLARAKSPATGKSALHGRRTTCRPACRSTWSASPTTFLRLGAMAGRRGLVRGEARRTTGLRRGESAVGGAGVGDGLDGRCRFGSDRLVLRVLAARGHEEERVREEREGEPMHESDGAATH
jgi:putative intracellular protease/amidase